MAHVKKENGEKSKSSNLVVSLSILIGSIAVIGYMQLNKFGLFKNDEKPKTFSEKISNDFRSIELSPKLIFFGIFGIYSSLLIIKKIINLFKPDPLAYIPIAPRDSYLFGNFAGEKKTEYDGQQLVDYSNLLKSSVFLLPTPLGNHQLVIGDNVGLNYILHDLQKFPSTTFRTAFIRFVVGEGIIVANNHDHSRQRRALAPAFSQSHVRTLTPIFTEKSEELGKRLLELVEQGGQKEWKQKGEEDQIILNISELLDCASFDIIGKAGFGVDFDCIRHGLKGVKLANGYQKMLQSSVEFDLPRIILLILSGLTKPDWLSLPLCKANRIIRAQNTEIEKWTEQLIEEKVKRTQEMLAEGDEIALDEVNGDSPLDLMERIVRSNESLRNKKNDSYTMTEEELRGSIRTILFAGYETSSVATSFTLNYLANDQRILGKVQTQLLSFLEERKKQGLPERLNADELQSDRLSLLTNCIRETLRISPAVCKSDRMCMEDCIIPLGKPIPTRDGKSFVNQLHIPKGTTVGACFKLPNLDEQTWGKEPERWNPERWENLPSTYKDASMPGPAGVATFSNGPASCLGARFAMLEIIALLVSILSRIRLEPSKYEIKTSPVLVSRPVVKGLNVVGLPLRVIPLAKNTNST